MQGDGADIGCMRLSLSDVDVERGGWLDGFLRTLGFRHFQGIGVNTYATAQCPLRCGRQLKDTNCPLPPEVQRCTAGYLLPPAPYIAAVY